MRDCMDVSLLFVPCVHSWTLTFNAEQIVKIVISFLVRRFLLSVCTLTTYLEKFRSSTISTTQKSHYLRVVWLESI